MKISMKKLTLLGAILILGTSSFGMLEVLTPTDISEPPPEPSTQEKQWSGQATLPIQTVGNVIDLKGKYALYIKPESTAGANDNILVIDFGEVGRGTEKDGITNRFIANIVSEVKKDDGEVPTGGEATEWRKYQIAANETAAVDVVKAVFDETGLSTGKGEGVSDDGKYLTINIEVPVEDSDLNAAPTMTHVGIAEHQMTTKFENEARDFVGTITSKIDVATSAPHGSFEDTTGGVVFTVTNFTKQTTDKGVAIRGDIKG